ncbi:polysaccharide biosynthesis protein [Paenibacillus hunanensis]|uniref:UDP-N-acetylglucosamine 4,6-dehydratase family protein n=1 Tax=Paenibacillus hunanensis TaxID=539262 RepID=UPI002026161A|nr:UDP-N-acetylglucosamine 4,6-dehydratase family protein [Paenibacillus hunanensis]MCL9662764.1 polysaccharide biosynthesis protein [Paenibacillus hunanensis]
MGIYRNKKILITGGTGTIGNHLIKQLLNDDPQVIRIFSRDEYKQYEMGIQFQEYAPKLRFLIGDVRDQNRLIRAMKDIDYVFHLAAMKHVPFCEYNPFEAVQTNIIGTQNVIQAAIANNVQKVLFTSTDKAISPTNTYGSTKLTGERLISSAEWQKGSIPTVFSAVRFGNVMGSRGSVIPLFKKQVMESQPITITDPNMLRYMMTPSQAIDLILKANESAQGGEVFVLKMPVVRIGDLANALIELVTEKYGITSDTAIQYVGLRPGEKQFEELMTLDERVIAEENEDMYIIPPIFKAKSTQIKPDPMDLPMIPVDESLIKQWLIQEELI